MIIIHSILIAGSLFGIWLFYELFKYKFGDRVKDWFRQEMKIIQAGVIERDLERKRKLKLYERNQVQFVEVEEVNQPRNRKPRSYEWNVSNSSQLGENRTFTELIIIDDGNS